MVSACFTYGSLMCEDIMSRVTGRAFSGESARLKGYARHPVLGEDYPGMVADPDGWIKGRLYRSLDESALARLDAFEGEMYERIRVEVVVHGGEFVEAWCYVIRDRFLDRLGPGDWDHEAFLREGKARFLARYVGFGVVDGDA